MKDSVLSAEGAKKEYKRWEKSERSGDKNKSIEVQEIENGFLVSITEENYGKNYTHECKKWYSEINPLDKETPMKSDGGLMKAIEKFNEDF